MILHFAINGILVFFATFLQQGDPIKLVPVDAGVEDRGTLSDSLRVVQKDLRLNHSFEQLFKVAGSQDIYIRKAGGLRAVFRNPIYIETARGSIPIVPAGTVYCIGPIRSDLLQQLGYVYEVDQPDTQESIYTPPIQQPSIQVPRQEISIPKRVSTIRFFDDATYRRKRLASFVLDVVAQE